MLSNRLGGVPVLSSGDLLRNEIADKTDLGVKIETFVNSGQLVPNELLFELFHKNIKQHTNGIILDGFIRELENHHLVTSVCESLGLRIICMINLIASYETLLQRLQERKQILNRADDDISILERRYSVYSKHCEPVTSVYKKTFRLVDVDTEGTVDYIQSKIQWKLTNYLPIPNRFMLVHSLLVHSAGGAIEDGIFVTRPGIMLVSNVGLECSSNVATFLIAGCSSEAMTELCAHGEASVARLTCSKTKSMNDTLYRVFPELHSKPISTEWQKQMILSAIELRRQYKKHSDGGCFEVFNMFNLSTKCVSLCYSMDLGSYHKLFIGRTQEPGNESEVRSIVKEMNAILHRLYPTIIRSHDDYSQMGNSDKYAAVEFYPPKGLYFTKLTDAAKDLFRLLNINMEQPEHFQLTEFRSRITYLAFLKSTPSLSETMAYHEMIIGKLGHLSVLGGFQVIEDGVSKSFKKIFQLHCEY